LLLPKSKTVLLELPIDDAHQIFGSPDDMKLRYSMTLFSQAENAPSLFQKVLDKFFVGLPDEKTLQILKNIHNPKS
jgi:uncharacterized protein (DUF1810 family)